MNKAKSVVDVNGVRYELVELLGRGGQGAVYAVKGGRLAVKLVAGCGQKHRERMRNQLTHVRRLPVGALSLAKPLEMLRPPHTGYVMELLTGMAPIKRLLAPPKGEGPSVEWYLRSGGLRRRLLVLGRAAHVLAQLHGKGLAYSDPSPANIFISDDPSFAEVWFIDTDNLRYESAPGSLAGVYTPGYGAPELVQGRSGVTTLTDVHAFAIIAFQALALAHPFIGDLVNDGEPELEEQAFAGMLPWIDDAEDDRNRASFGVPREWVLSARLAEAFQRTFGAGRLTPSDRPGAAEWAERLFAAADATIRCPGCGGTFYFNQRQCTWCDAARPTFATAVFHLWDPNHGASGGILTKPQRGSVRPVVVGHGAVTSASAFTVTRRLAFDQMGPEADEPVVEASLTNDRISIRGLDGEQYPLFSASGDRHTIVSDRSQTVRLAAGQASWRLHFGDKSRLHRVLSFELRPGREP
jgi:DNA-binding helix-hairpin-helix protein with protein kinase domain